MSELAKKVKRSIERFKTFEPPEGYFLAFSGGKDSVVIKRLAQMAGVKFDAHYNVTSVDPPELVRFVKDKHPDVVFDYPRYDNGKQKTMWSLIEHKKWPPLRIMRYCCEHLKENGGEGRIAVTGVRWQESVNRSKNQGIVTLLGKRAENEVLIDSGVFSATKRGGVVLLNDNTDARKMVDQCYQKRRTVLNPIIDWSEDDVWEFIRGEKCEYCGLYDEGYSRLGCIGCPMASRHGREREFLRWPTYKRAYIRAFDKMLKARTEAGLATKLEFSNGLDVFNWWMEYEVLPGQIDLLEEYEEAGNG